MSFKTDLHIHSTCSDGMLTPTEIVERYSAAGYDLIALTDHENADGFRAAEEAGKKKNMRVIPGAEIAAVFEEREIHILGYYFDTDNSRLSEFFEQLREIRDERNDKLLSVLCDMGYQLDKKDLIQRDEQTYIGKPNFARALVKRGYISCTAEAFKEGVFLESDQAKAVERQKPSAEKVIEYIKGAGGIPVLAHPYKIKGLGQRGSTEFKENFDRFLAKLKKTGIKGVECVYPKHSDAERLFFIDEAAKFHLHITEGSDFHGDGETDAIKTGDE